MKFLNLGCGLRYCLGWTNMDFVSCSKEVVAHNLLKGIPFPDDTFDVVYHSHVIEHFPKTDAQHFIKECYRVLKPGGIIRVVVPDLEGIVNQYIHWRTLALQGDRVAEANYDWIMLEMYDQSVRHYSGGEMGKYLTQAVVPNEGFVKLRMGAFYGIVRRQVSESRSSGLKSKLGSIVWIRNIYDCVNGILPTFLHKYNLGKFRLNGEPHLWMYDRFSLSRLLSECLFKDARICTAHESRVTDWITYHLDTDADGMVYKKDSLYIEAIK